MSVMDLDIRIKPAQTLGVPTQYRSTYDREARALCLLGAKDAELANHLGIEINTLFTWRKEYPSFDEAIKQGRVKGDAHVAESLYHRAIGATHKATKIFLPPGSREPVFAEYIEELPPDTAAAFIWLKNRRPQDWRDKKELDITGSVEARLDPSVRALMDTMVSLLSLEGVQQTIESTAIDITPLTDDPSTE